MFNQAPGAGWIEGISCDGNSITIPLSSLPQLTAADADPATGDIRKVVFALCERIWRSWNGLASADRPTKLTVVKSASANVATGTITNSYNITVITQVTAQQVAPEV